MAYSDYTLSEIKDKFQIIIDSYFFICEQFVFIRGETFATNEHEFFQEHRRTKQESRSSQLLTMTHKKKKTKQKKLTAAAAPETKNIVANPVPPDTGADFQAAVVHHQSGNFQQAEAIYKKILEVNPNHSDALHLLGILVHQAGKKDAAMELINKAIQIQPERANYHNNLGIMFQEQGELENALACYRNALKIRPNFADVYNNMAFALQDQKKLDEAVSCYETAVKINPAYFEAYNNLGTALKEQGRADEAVAAYQKALQLKPDYPEAYSNMGIALKEQGRFQEAIACYQKALQLRPDYAEAFNNMGSLFRDMSRSDDALSCYRKAVEIKPDYADAYSNMGTVFKEQGKFAEAFSCYQKALQIKPDNCTFYLNMGNTFQDQGKPNEAIACYRKALEINPNYAVAYNNMRNAYIYQGKVAEAVWCCEKSLEINYDFGTEIRKALMLPVIYESREQIEYYRRKILQEIESLGNKGLTLEDPNRQVGATNFYLAYHGLNDKDIQQKIASFYMQVCPELAWISPAVCFRTEHGKIVGVSPCAYPFFTTRDKQHGQPQGVAPTPDAERPGCIPTQSVGTRKPIRLGIVSMHLFNMSQQTIGKLTRGIIKNLSREKFQVKLFRFSGGESNLIKAINEGADEVIDLPSDMKAAREIIARHDLDVLFYPDIGMDSMTYFLAFSRLARVQCVTWGHPVTTGIPNMDYFISSKHLEPPGAQDHYSEKLVLLNRLPVYYYPPEMPEEQPSREKFGLPREAKLYVCPQAPFKFHPDFDAALGSILRRDPRGLLILIEGHHFEHWAELLLKRFRKTFPDVIDRVRFLKAMPTKDFLCLLKTADALLEPPYFGGGNTTYESFACGIPIVTWPGPFMRGRVTLGCYRQMGVTDCVAADPQSYIEIALRLANDSGWRQEVSHKIRANAHVIFEDMEAVRELERFFEAAVKQKIPLLK
jgi:predicted O-linked N-acetylglucosamine transferase (SPINDLY family)